MSVSLSVFERHAPQLRICGSHDYTRETGMTSVAWVDEEETKGSSVRWKGRNVLNFVVGRSSSSRVRALPVVIHFLPEDIEWFSSVRRVQSLRSIFPPAVGGVGSRVRRRRRNDRVLQ